MADHELEMLIASLTDELNLDACCVYRTTAEGDRLVRVIKQGRGPEECLPDEMPARKSLTGFVAQTGKVLSVKDPAVNPHFRHLVGPGEGTFKTFLGIPLKSRGSIAGVLVVQNTEAHLYKLHEVSLLHATGREVEQLLNVA
jgi:phosphotransferase system enzyme I (PtsP)